MNGSIARGVLCCILLSLAPGAARGEGDICEFPDIDAFLETCPTGDPALSRILSDFRITKDGAPVAVDSIQCSQPISAMPIQEVTDELSLLQVLRVVYHLNGDRCGYLPWTPMSLYDWLRSKVAGFNIDSDASYDSCCGTWPGGGLYVTLRQSNDSNRAYHRTWEGAAEWIALLMHEARHVDGFGHVRCCPAQPSTGPNACDQTYDEGNLAPFAIQFWLEQAFLRGVISTGYTCLSSERTNAIRDWLMSAANMRLDRFCTNAPAPLTDASVPPPTCDPTCATSVSCNAPAWGDPASFLSLRHDSAGNSTLGTLSTSGAVADRFGLGQGFDALTFAAPDLGYGPDLFYFLRRDSNGFSTFGTISASGAVVDRFGVGLAFDALAFAAPDLGYGPNLFYFLRRDSSGFSTFGTISTSGAITDRFGVGLGFDALAFAAPDLGYGPSLFYFLRSDSSGFSTFGTISTSGAITDRFGVGLGFDDVAFAPATPIVRVPASVSRTATSASGAVVEFESSALDALGGPLPTICDRASGSRFPPGVTRVTCTAIDGRGNVGIASFDVTVTFEWSGVLRPLDPNARPVLKLGRTVPVKFRLTGASQGIQDLVATLAIVKVTNDVPGTTEAAVSISGAASGAAFRFDPLSGNYVLNLATAGLSVGTWALRIQMGDRVDRAAMVSFRP